MKLDKLKSAMHTAGLTGAAAGTLFSTTPAYAWCLFCEAGCAGACVTGQTVTCNNSHVGPLVK